MKSPNQFQGVFLHRDPVDMRKAINGLSQIVQDENMGDLMGSYLFVFCGRRKDRIKVLYFDQSGFALWQKRLEKAKFQWPRRSEMETVKLTPEQFNWLLDGYDIWKMKPFEKLHYSLVS